LGKDCRGSTASSEIEMQYETAKPPGFFITGTNTEVGKTYVTALLAKCMLASGIRVGVYKPVASGCIARDGKLVSKDAEQLWNPAGRPESLYAVTPQCFAAPLAPNVAAREEGKTVDAKLLRTGLQRWLDYQCVLVEGVGGLMSPISDGDLVIDLAEEFAFPIIIVVANELGCINQTLQTIAVARARELSIAGIVMNCTSQQQDQSSATNVEELARWTDVPILASVGWNETQIDLSQFAPDA